MKKRKTLLWILLILIFLCLAAAGVFGYRYYLNLKAEKEAERELREKLQASFNENIEALRSALAEEDEETAPEGSFIAASFRIYEGEAGYVIRDTNGDGVYELLLGQKADGIFRIYNIYTGTDASDLRQVYTADGSLGLILLQNGIFVNVDRYLESLEADETEEDTIFQTDLWNSAYSLEGDVLLNAVMPENLVPEDLQDLCILSSES